MAENPLFWSWISLAFVIDVSGGDGIPRKGGPGVAPHFGVDLDLLVRQAREVRGERPVLLTNCRKGEGLEAVIAMLERDVLFRV